MQGNTLLSKILLGNICIIFSLEGYVEERYVAFLKQKGKADQVVTNVFVKHFFKNLAQQVCAALRVNVSYF